MHSRKQQENGQSDSEGDFPSSLPELDITSDDDQLLPEIFPDYLSDSSDDETTNTIGNIPISWYDEYDHIGYDINGKKILKPASADQLDTFLSQMDDPNAWRSVFNEIEGKNVVLTAADLKMIKRIQEQKYPDESFNPHPDSVDFFTYKKEIHPISSAPEPKSRFTPSKWEAKKIMKIVRSIRKGWKTKGDMERAAASKPHAYGIWDDDEDKEKIDSNHIPAPKLSLPKNKESYNPPVEYLPDENEEKELLEEIKENKMLFVPKKYSSMRAVPAYSRFIGDRFDRCLDLYLCPRMIKKRIQVDQESLVPKLPDPKDLQPFPSREAIIYKGHESKVKSISINPTGHWLASGSDDCTVKVWEVSTGRLLKSWTLEESICTVSWNPNKSISILAVVVGKRVILLNPQVEPKPVQQTTESIFTDSPDIQKSKNQTDTKWITPTSAETSSGFCMVIEFKQILSHINWHRKGDYFATLTTQATGSSSLIHQLSKQSTQNPFKKSNGLVQRVAFHPTKPILFIATQRYVRVYNMTEQKLIQKLQSGVNWISSLSIHPQGDNVIIGSYDGKMCWFDTDLSAKPYRVLKYHKAAIRDVQYHSRYPLFASCSDDGSVNVFHGMVYADMMLNPLIVPLKSLKTGGGVVHDLAFHPTQPWVFSASEDGIVRLFN